MDNTDPNLSHNMSHNNLKGSIGKADFENLKELDNS